MSLVRLQSVSKHFIQGKCRVEALKQISLEVNEGEFTALVGPSGSGKTTLLNLIGALDVASEGQVRIAENVITSLKESELASLRLHQIGFVFQSYNLVPVLNALENVELVLLLQGRSREESRERARHYLTLVGLEQMMHRRPAELSGGQQQRVAVARAIACAPKLVLADEPTANLDSANAESLLQIMHQLCKEDGVTFLFSTHDPRVMKWAERIITLRDGEVVADEYKASGQ